MRAGDGVVLEHELVLVLLVARLGRRRKRARLERVAEREVVVLDGEDVREVVAELERELEADLLHALVLDAEAVLHALADEAVARDRDRVLGELAGESGSAGSRRPSSTRPCLPRAGAGARR